MGGSGGAFAGLADRHPGFVLDLPVAERGNLGLAVGMALAGDRVVVEVTSTGRLWSCLEVLSEAAAVSRAGAMSVALVVRVPAGGQAGDRIDAPVAQALAAIDGLTLLCPATPAQALGAYRAALAARRPVVVLEPRALAARRTAEPDAVSIGAARPVRDGVDLTLVCWGSAVQVAVSAADTLAAEGIDAAVLDLVSLSPLDAATLGEHLRRTGRVVVVEAPEGGLSEQVLRAAVDGAFLYLEAPLATAAANASELVQVARSTALY